MTLDALATIGRHAMTLPVPAMLLMPAKLVAIGADLEMDPAAVAALVEATDVAAIVAADPSAEAKISPVARVEFAEAIVFGTVTDAASISKGKTWGGRILSVKPLEPTDRVHPDRITYTLKPTSKQRQRWEWRDTLKHLLGRDRRLITLAMYHGKAKFIAGLTAADVAVLQRKVDLDPAAFWIATRHGERLGVNSIEAYLQRLEERRTGYSFDFGDLVQIQPVA